MTQAAWPTRPVLLQWHADTHTASASTAATGSSLSAVSTTITAASTAPIISFGSRFAKAPAQTDNGPLESAVHE